MMKKNDEKNKGAKRSKSCMVISIKKKLKKITPLHRNRNEDSTGREKQQLDGVLVEVHWRAGKPSQPRLVFLPTHGLWG